MQLLPLRSYYQRQHICGEQPPANGAGALLRTAASHDNAWCCKHCCRGAKPCNASKACCKCTRSTVWSDA